MNGENNHQKWIRDSYLITSAVISLGAGKALVRKSLLYQNIYVTSNIYINIFIAKQSVKEYYCGSLIELGLYG